MAAQTPGIREIDYSFTFTALIAALLFILLVYLTSTSIYFVNLAFTLLIPIARLNSYTQLTSCSTSIDSET